VALRATTASCVFLDGFTTGRAVFFCSDVFFAPGGFAVFRAADFEWDGADVAGFAGHTFGRGTPRAAAGFRAGLAVRVTTMDVGELLEAEPIPPKIPLSRFYFLRILESKGPSQYTLQWNFNLTFAAGIRGWDTWDRVAIIKFTPLAKEYEPEPTKNQHCETSADGQKHKYGRAGLGLACLRGRLHDLMLFPFHAPSSCNPSGSPCSAREEPTPDLWRCSLLITCGEGSLGYNEAPRFFLSVEIKLRIGRKFKWHRAQIQMTRLKIDLWKATEAGRHLGFGVGG
jgi:hypothetical protein